MNLSLFLSLLLSLTLGLLIFLWIKLKKNQKQLHAITQSVKEEKELIAQKAEERIQELINKSDWLNQELAISEKSLRETLENTLSLVEKLKIKEEWLAETQRIARIGSWEYDIVKEEIFWSDEIYTIFGMQPSGIVPSFEEYLKKVHEEDKDSALNAITAAIERGIPYEIEMRHVFQDGSIHWVLAMGKPILDEEGKVIKLIGIAYNIDERKKGEIALRQSEQFFKALIQNSSDFVQTVDEQGKIIYQSPTYYKLSGYSIEERKGKSVLDLIHPDDRPDARNFMRSVMENPGITETVSVRLMRKDGIQIWVEATASNLLSEPMVKAIVVNTREITLRKNAEEKLKEQNEELKKINAELDSFVYRASHDLRAPLSSLLGLINIAVDEKDENYKMQYFSLMKKSVEKLDTFIRNIIDYSRNSRLQVSVAPINFKNLIHDAFEELKYMERSDDIIKQLKIEVTEDFYSDLFRLNIIFNNIISNAIRYSNSRVQSFINIEIKSENNTVRIIISDNGNGIAEESVDKIFQMFYRAADQNVGSGLGLYIVKEAVTALKGAIRVESQLGIGSSFIIEIPNLKDVG